MVLSWHLIYSLTTFLTDAVLGELIFQTYDNGFAAVMQRRKKVAWPKHPIQIGAYNLTKAKDIEQAKGFMGNFWLGQAQFRRHDPLNIIHELGKTDAK